MATPLRGRGPQKEYNKNTGSNFPHLLAPAMALSSSLILKKCLFASFFFSVIKHLVVPCLFFVVFVHALVAFTHNSKEPSTVAEKQFHNAWSLQENNARSAAKQSARTIVAI